MKFYLFTLLSLSLASELYSYLLEPQELTIEGNAGIKLINGDGNCRLGVFNSTYPFGLICRDYAPLYFDDNRKTHFGVSVLTEASLTFGGKLILTNVDQWALTHYDAFEGVEGEGWSNQTITECGGVRMLGGYCQFSAGESWKEFKDLPEHSQLRVKANYHMIDEWRGETAYLKIGSSDDMETVWTQSYDVNSSKDPMNICGEDDVGEGKFSIAVDIKIDHSDSSVIISFGSTLEQQPCEKSWGISGLQIYIR
ncbi:unnamed protein product [Blepharisma stoltei]|uniref:Uncharacterized protein n=1 Tax=Blepharisma stoltei TaxID=1481888 RepID=A0AAU9J7S1_9CILI|nr:unnamed protein product [Blepharisma stoltei]